MARRSVAKDITGSEGSGLAGRRVVLCVAGSVAAYKAIDVARLLMRHGADVTCVVSDAAARLIRPEYFRWATGNAPVTRLTGRLEHVELADYGRSDLVIVYPATANTIGKLASGIDDTVVSTVLTVALGSKTPIIACMAMHAAMHANPAVRRNATFLRKSIEFVEPTVTEGKAKAPEPDAVLRRALKMVGATSVLRGRRALVVAGPTSERIDAVRSIVSHSTGETGALVAAELASAGARVRMVYGPGCARPPEGIKVIDVTSAAEMERAVRKELRAGADIIVMAAAVSDYAPSSPSRSKIKSGRANLTIRLRPTPKIVDGLRRLCPGAIIVAFKAEAGASGPRLAASARSKMAECDADIVVANDIRGASPGRRMAVMVERGRPVRKARRRSAAEIARGLRAAIEARAASDDD